MCVEILGVSRRYKECHLCLLVSHHKPVNTVLDLSLKIELSVCHFVQQGTGGALLKLGSDEGMINIMDSNFVMNTAAEVSDHYIWTSVSETMSAAWIGVVRIQCIKDAWNAIVVIFGF